LRLQAKGVTATGNIKNITRLCQVSDVPIEELIPKKQTRIERETKRDATSLVGTWFHRFTKF
jgi:hypothetical protein